MLGWKNGFGLASGMIFASINHSFIQPSPFSDKPQRAPRIMSPSQKNDAQVLEEMLSEPVLTKLLSLAKNGFAPTLPQLLERVVDLGIKQLEEELHPINGKTIPDGLSPRQTSILYGLRNGYAVGEIATNLGIAETTTRTHITRIKDKFGCHDLLNLRLPGCKHSDSML